MSDVDAGADGPKKSDEELAAEWAAAMEDGDGGGAAVDPDDVLAEAASGAPADSTPAATLPALEEGVPAATPGLAAAAADGGQNLDVILDIPVRLSMEVGNTQVSIGELLKLNRGSVVELDRLAGEPLDVLVNGTLVAHGEVVVINDKFGVRLIDVLSPQDRIKTLS